MRAAIRSLRRYPARNIIYATFLTTAFTTINLLINTYIMEQNLMISFNEFRGTLNSSEEINKYREIFNIQTAIQASALLLIPVAALIILLCVLIFPFLQYLFSIERGYEIGVLRALGLSKSRVWVRMFVEDVTLTLLILVIALCITVTAYRSFAGLLLSLDNETKNALTENLGDLSGVYTFNWQSALFSLGSAVAITMIASGLSNIHISNSAPLKLIRQYK